MATKRARLEQCSCLPEPPPPPSQGHIRVLWSYTSSIKGATAGVPETTSRRERRANRTTCPAYCRQCSQQSSHLCLHQSGTLFISVLLDFSPHPFVPGEGQRQSLDQISAPTFQALSTALLKAAYRKAIVMNARKLKAINKAVEEVYNHVILLWTPGLRLTGLLIDTLADPDRGSNWECQ